MAMLRQKICTGMGAVATDTLKNENSLVNKLHTDLLDMLPGEQTVWSVGSDGGASDAGKTSAAGNSLSMKELSRGTMASLSSAVFPFLSDASGSQVQHGNLASPAQPTTSIFYDNCGNQKCHAVLTIGSR